MSEDEKEEDSDHRSFGANSKKRARDGQFSQSRSDDLDEALGGKREVPEDGEHVTMVPEHVPMEMRTDDESDSDDE